MSLYKETLMSHFRNPKHKIEDKEADVIQDGVNPSCGDSITIYINMDNNNIQNISYTGTGCAISMAATDILCDLITKSNNPINLTKDFIAMLNGDTEIEFTKEFSKLEVFKELQEYPARKGCAILPWKTLLTVLENTK